MVRTIGRVAYHKSMQTIHEESGEPTGHDPLEYYKDPRNIGRFAEKRFEQMGVDMPQHLQEEIKAAREGVLPKQLSDLQNTSPDASYH